jgi:hypothetical protein
LLAAGLWCHLTWIGCLAAGVIPVPIESLATRADTIVRGTVESMESSRGVGRSLSTAVELRVSEVWKGPSTNRVGVVLVGGILGDRQVILNGQPAFKVGEDVVVFLVRNERGEGVVLELAQGKFLVTTDSAKQSWVSNGIVGTAGGQADPSTKSQSKAVIPYQRPMGLEEIKRRVSEALKP